MIIIHLEAEMKRKRLHLFLIIPDKILKLISYTQYPKEKEKKKKREERERSHHNGNIKETHDLHVTITRRSRQNDT